MAEKRIVTVTLVLDDGVEKRIDLDPTRLPLIFLEALDDLKENNSGGWRKLRRGIQKMLRLTDEESEALNSENLEAITSAISAAQAIPNG